MDVKIHVAGKQRAGVQKCSRCKEVLLDWPSRLQAGGPEIPPEQVYYFPVGGNVVVQYNPEVDLPEAWQEEYAPKKITSSAEECE